MEWVERRKTHRWSKRPAQNRLRLPLRLQMLEVATVRLLNAG
jgi:hypothetical protein